MVRILGIDPGTLIAGYGAVDERRGGGAHALIECGVIRLKRGDPMERRLLELRQRLGEIMDRVAPDAVAIERPFVARNVQTAFAIGEARGVALLVAAERGIPVRQYPPAEVKSTVAGHGQASKTDVAQMLRRQVKLPEADIPEDATDALAVALCDLVRAASLQFTPPDLLR